MHALAIFGIICGAGYAIYRFDRPKYAPMFMIASFIGILIAMGVASILFLHITTLRACAA